MLNSKQKQEFEHEFLRLAAIYLACRFQVMGGYVYGNQPWKDKVGEIQYRILGMIDYETEMKLIVWEELGRVLTSQVSPQA